MPADPHPRAPSALQAKALRMAVHWDAFKADPAAYARALRWRINGKRLRAQLTLAPLLGQSPRAYRLWQIEREAHPAKAEAADQSFVRLTALIEPGEGQAKTLASCAREGIEGTVISAPDDLSSALDKVTEDTNPHWIMPLNAGDLLFAGAGAHYRAAAARADGNTPLIYADDDLLDEQGNRHSPHLKPDWNAELFAHFDCVTHASILNASAVRLSTLPAEIWAEALTKQAIEAYARGLCEPVHLQRVLHHRLVRPSPNLPLAPLAPRKDEANYPSVSVLVPTRNAVGLLRTCLEGLARTEYPGRLEIVVIDNGSDDSETLEYLAALNADFAQVIRDDGPFNFAAINNRAAHIATGDLLCFLNNDIEIDDPNWLTIMAQQAMREEVGAVGARLLYPNGRIQHAGVVIGIGGAAAHAHRGLSPEEEGYFHRHGLPQFASAVTAACMVVSRAKFEAVGGFDEERFAVSFNDVDLCLRLREKGWKTLYEPRATLIHHESVTRGFERDGPGAARETREAAALQERWDTDLASGCETRERPVPDLYHHPELSPLSERFVLRL